MAKMDDIIKRDVIKTPEEESRETKEKTKSPEKSPEQAYMNMMSEAINLDEGNLQNLLKGAKLDSVDRLKNTAENFLRSKDSMVNTLTMTSEGLDAAGLVIYLRNKNNSQAQILQTYESSGRKKEKAEVDFYNKVKDLYNTPNEDAFIQHGGLTELIANPKTRTEAIKLFGLEEKINKLSPEERGEMITQLKENLTEQEEGREESLYHDKGRVANFEKNLNTMDRKIARLKLIIGVIEGMVDKAE